jgi:hypothetical protein
MKSCRFFAFLVVGALAIPGAASGAASKTKSLTAATMPAAVRALVAQAPANFSAIRAAARLSRSYYVHCNLKRSFAVCPGCSVYDYYARGKYPEDWRAYAYVDLPDAYTAARIEPMLRPQLSRILAGYSLHRSTTKYGTTVLAYTGPGGMSVEARVFKGGANIQVRHTLPQAVHVLRPPSKAALSNLRAGVTNMMRLSLSSAEANFDAMRGPAHKDFMGNQEYVSTVNFGSLFDPCTITDIDVGDLSKIAKWVFGCDTIYFAGTKAELEPVVRDAVAQALSSDFTATTDEQYLLLDDYRWDNRSNVSVNIGSSEDDGVLSFRISIYHFLPRDSGG